MSWNNNHQMLLILCFGLGVDFAFEMFFLCFSIPVISSISFCFSCCCLYSLNSFYNVFFLSFFNKLFNSTELVLLYYMLGLFFEYQFYFF